MLLLCCLQTFAVDFFAPQKWPEKGPWFEGWYIRLTDPANKRSFAVIVTSYTNDANKQIDKKNLKGYQAFLIDDEAQLSKPYVIEDFPKKTEISNFWLKPNSLTEN